MSLSLAPRHLARYRDLIRLLRKYGGSDWVRSAGLGDELDEDDGGSGPQMRAEADELATDLESLGPTYTKLGQLLSTRADLLPEPHLKALSRLQDDVEPFPFEDVEAILDAELGVRPASLFETLDPVPVASASLGQVQRPGVRRQILDDLEVLGGLAEVVDEHTEAGRTFGFADMFEQFRRSLLAELDYRAEASNLVTMADQLAEFERIVVPRPIGDYSTGKVLTMEYVAGRKVTDLGPLGRMELDGRGLATELFEAYLEQILGAGFLHADPHPGNVLVTDDGRLALVDLGMVSHIGARMQERLVKLLLAVGEGRGDEVATQAVEMGTPLTGFDRRRLERDTVDLVARHHGARLGQVGAGSILAELLAISGQCRLRPPVELTMLGKALLNLDEVARTLDPDFDPQAAIRTRAGELVQRRAWTTQGGLMRAALETREFVEQLPGRANRLLDRLDEGQLSIKVDAIDEKELLRGVEKLANRVTTGLILAAIIIGAAMTMRVETSSTLFGYPSISIVFFVVAVLGGFALVGATLVGDRRRRRRQDGP